MLRYLSIWYASANAIRLGNFSIIDLPLDKTVEVNNTVVNTTTTEVPTENNVQYDKFCSSCGAGVTKDTTVCPSCGAPLD